MKHHSCSILTALCKKKNNSKNIFIKRARECQSQHKIV